MALAVATAAFAAAMSLSLRSRAAVVESGALERALAGEFDARTAATRVVQGIVGEQVSASGEVSPDAPGGDASSPEVDTDELPEMPEFMREFLEGMLEQDDDEGGEAEAAEPVRATSTQRATRFLAARGLPAAAVRVELPGGVHEVRVRDASSVIDLNRAAIEELEGLVLAVGGERGLARRVAAEIVDYRDGDDFVTPLGAERAAYELRGLTIRNGPLRSVEELGYLPSMTPELLRALRPVVTVMGDGRLHAASVPEAVLLALPGMTTDSARRIVSLRESGRLDAETLETALSGFSRDLAERFRFEPSPALRVDVRRVDGMGAAFTGLAVVTPSEGVQWASFGAIEWTEDAWD